MAKEFPLLAPHINYNKENPEAMMRVLETDLKEVIVRLKRALDDHKAILEGRGDPIVFPSYTVATLPAPASWTGGAIFVTDEVGGAVLAFSDGSDWRRCTDRSVVT